MEAAGRRIGRISTVRAVAVGSVTRRATCPETHRTLKPTPEHAAIWRAVPTLQPWRTNFPQAES